uniref:Uncharacterized protein n=1 Tax=Fagus sylvatica TaxID=28930 RepID=A0A2N9HCQ5_FAGSY
MSDFDVLGTVGKLALPTFCKVPDSRESELGLVRYGPANRGHRGVFGPFEDSFPIGIPARPGRLCAQAWQRRWENSGIFSTALFRRPVFTRVVDVAPDVGFRRSWYRRKACATYFSTELLTIRKLHVVAEVNLLPKGLQLCGPSCSGFDHNFLVSRPFSTRKVSESKLLIMSLYGMVKGWSVRFQLLVWSTVRSNLGQTWSTLVKLGQSSSKLWEMYLRTMFWGFLGMVDPSRVGNGSVKPRSTLGQLWSNLVNLGQTWSDFGKCVPDLLLRSYLTWQALVRIRPAWFGLSRFACRHPRKSRGVKMGL